MTRLVARTIGSRLCIVSFSLGVLVGGNAIPGGVNLPGRHVLSSADSRSRSTPSIDPRLSLRSPREERDPDIVAGSDGIRRINPQAADRSSITRHRGEVDFVRVEFSVGLDRKGESTVGAESFVRAPPEDLGMIAARAKGGAEVKPRSIFGAPPLFRTHELWIGGASHQVQVSLDREARVNHSVKNPVLAVAVKVMVGAGVADAAGGRD